MLNYFPSQVWTMGTDLYFALLPSLPFPSFTKEINTFLSSTAVPPDVPEPGPKSAHPCLQCSLLGNSCGCALFCRWDLSQFQCTAGQRPLLLENICPPSAGGGSLTNQLGTRQLQHQMKTGEGENNSAQLGARQWGTIVSGLVVEEIWELLCCWVHLLRMSHVLCSWHTSF